MATTKNEIVDRITKETNAQRQLVSTVVQSFIDEIITELAKDNRIEFREFGIFDIYERPPRLAQNPKTLEKLHVPAKRVIKFKAGKAMKEAINKNDKKLLIQQQSQAELI